MFSIYGAKIELKEEHARREMVFSGKDLFFKFQNRALLKVEVVMDEIVFKDLKELLPYFLKHKHLCTNYDEKADVLYVNFKENSVSDDSELTKDDLIIRYDGEEVVGITVLNASKRK